jgi:hypothetical protein
MAQERINVIEEFLNNNKINSKISRMARASSLYSAGLLSFFSTEVHGRKMLIKSICAGRGYVPGFKILHFFYIFFLPYSRYFKPFAERFLKRKLLTR